MAFATTPPRIGGRFNYIRFALRMRVPLALATMVFALLGLGMNFVGANGGMSFGGATHPVTTLCLFLLGLSVLRLRRVGKTQVWRYVVGMGIITICTVRLMQAEMTHITGAPTLPIFGPIGAMEGTFGVEAAMVLGAFATASVLRQNLAGWGVVFLMLGLGLVFHGLVEINFGIAPLREDVGGFTLLGLVSVALSMVSKFMHRPMIRVCFLQGGIGQQARVMALAVIGIPWAFGYGLLMVRDFEAAFVSFDAAMVSFVSWSLLVVTLFSVSRLEGMDRARDTAERETALARRIDPVTQALSRSAMSELLDAAWIEFKGSGAEMGILLVDVANLRRIDETYGRDTRADVLERIALTLAPQLRDHDALSRWSEDVFLVILKVKDHADLGIVQQRLRKALLDEDGQYCRSLNGHPPEISVMLGQGAFADTDTSPIDTIARAQAELDMAKDALSSDTVPKFALEDDPDTLVFVQDAEADAHALRKAADDHLAA